MAEDHDVLAANQAFYDAHERRDLTAMMASWEASDRIVCTHPGWPILRGYEDVAESWRRILTGPGTIAATNVFAGARRAGCW